MSAGIDHVAKAADLLVVTVEDTPEGYARKVAVAQAHAMLALVEQQRISNLIAYVNKWTDDEVLDVDAEIRKVLGIE